MNFSLMILGSNKFGLDVLVAEHKGSARYKLEDSGVLHVWTEKGLHFIYSPGGWLSLKPGDEDAAN